VTIVDFSSPDDLLRAIDEARRNADSRVLDFQKNLKPGDLCVSYYAEECMFVFHEVRDPLDGIEEPEERDYLRESYADPNMRHYRFSRSYSVLCPEGELGDIHVSTVSLVIPVNVWEACKKSGWGDHDRVVALLREHSRRVAALTFGRVQDGQN
jgi:hypothetical protein